MIYKKRFFIITAHPDDLESGCGGLVSKITANGGHVTNLILVKPSAEKNPNRDKDIVSAELEKSKKILNFETIIYDTPLHENGRPDLRLTNNLISFAETCAEDHDILITHWREDHHQDHRVCYDVGRSIGRNNFEAFWCMDEPPYNLHYRNFICNHYVDVTNFIDEKIKALNSYSTYFEPHDVEHIINYNRYRGAFLGPDRIAETFQIMYKKDI